MGRSREAAETGECVLLSPCWALAEWVRQRVGVWPGGDRQEDRRSAGAEQCVPDTAGGGPPAGQGGWAFGRIGAARKS